MATNARAKIDRPETIREAQTWDTVRSKYVEYGLCSPCAGQAAHGHQIGFTNVRPPCASCAPLLESLPVERPNGWRTPRGRACDPSKWQGINVNRGDGPYTDTQDGPGWEPLLTQAPSTGVA